MGDCFNTVLATRLLEKTENMASFAYAWNSTAGVPKYARSTLYKKLADNGIATNFVRGSKFQKIRSAGIDRILSGISVNRRLYGYEYDSVKSALGCKCVQCGCQQGLEIDHIDGNHNNTQIGNLQMLCGTCHNVKTSRQVWGKVA